MRKEYAVCLGKERIGSATVKREGLYYRIHCQCQLSGSIPCRIIVKGEKEVDLGLCVPMGDRFGIDTLIPVKRIGEGDLNFQVLPRHSKQDAQFIALSPEEPFRYISRLKDAYLVRQEGKLGLAFKNRSPNQPGSGQNP